MYLKLNYYVGSHKKIGKLLNFNSHITQAWRTSTHSTEHTVLVANVSFSWCNNRLAHLAVPPVLAECHTSCRPTQSEPKQLRQRHPNGTCLNTHAHLLLINITVPCAASGHNTGSNGDVVVKTCDAAPEQRARSQPSDQSALPHRSSTHG